MGGIKTAPVMQLSNIVQPKHEQSEAERLSAKRRRLLRMGRFQTIKTSRRGIPVLSNIDHRRPNLLGE